MTRPNPATAEGQLHMQRSADQRTLTICRTFNEIQTGPNPLTPAEVGALMQRHPGRYDVLQAWAE